MQALVNVAGRAIQLRARVADVFSLPAESIYRIVDRPGRVGNFAVVWHRGCLRFVLIGPQFYHAAQEDIIKSDARFIGVAVPFETFQRLCTLL